MRERERKREGETLLSSLLYLIVSFSGTINVVIIIVLTDYYFAIIILLIVVVVILALVVVAIVATPYDLFCHDINT